ncbi:ISChy2 transposase [Sporosarcina newyorkensis 2681]|uniref:ISChy2 transposase n=1 Tax=Sporosarcina newyorkensis 2681 TaxID=1027292 RepID=F9DXM2_9BACL|nr:IS110 family transposase [Sporosarcina newyorkensis]EGQ20296.1 ISChy2 transposase [Sporosarcina newyorkensis 2681]
MVMQSLKHIQGKNGSYWNRLMRNPEADRYCIVAVDAAKYVNAAMICTIYGDILKGPFEFDGSRTGFQVLQTAIKETREAYQLTDVILGIETTAHYYEDLVRVCMAQGYLVRILNAATTAKERETVLNYTKTDRVDLMAIIQSILHGRGATGLKKHQEFETLQTLTRAKRRLVNDRSRCINHLRLYSDHIFKEFQGKNERIDGKNQVVKIFDQFDSKSSLYLMRHHPHPEDLLSLGPVGLRKLSIQHNLKLREATIERLLSYARTSISKPKKDLYSELLLLRLKLDEYELLNRQVEELNEEIEALLLQTDGGILLSIPGVGVTIAAELTAEMGNLENFTSAGQLIKMAGTNPIVKQSGGKQASHYRISKQGRAPFRDIVYQLGKSTAQKNPEMNVHYQRLKDRGKMTGQAYIAIGNRMLRIAYAMRKKQILYQSQQPDYILQKVIAGKLRNKKKQALFYHRFVLSEPV